MPAKLLRSFGMVCACTMVGLLVTALWSPFTTTTYHSTARLLLSSQADIFTDEDPSTEQAERQAKAIQSLQSTAVAREVEMRLGFASTISPEADTTDVIAVRAFDSDPERAQLKAQAHAEGYLAVQEREWQAELSDTEAKLQVRIDELETMISSTDRATDTSGLEEQLRNLADSVDRLATTRALGNDNAALLLDDAQLSRDPFSVDPNTRSNLLLGGIVGLLAGVLIATLSARQEQR